MMQRLMDTRISYGAYYFEVQLLSLDRVTLKFLLICYVVPRLYILNASSDSAD